MPALEPVRRAVLAALACGTLLLTACSSGGSEGASTTEAVRLVEVDEVLQGIADDVIVPSYEALGSGLADLETATAALCEAPSTASLDAARSAWLDAVTAWQGTRAAGVGPALDERLMSDVAFAARPHVIRLLLERGDPVDVAAIDDEGAAARGLYAVEEALFGEGADELTGPQGARRCEYASSVATLAADAAEPIVERWTSGEAGQELVAGLDGDAQSSVAALANEATHRLEELDAMGLRDLAEASGPGELDETRRGGAADLRLADRKALLAGVSALVGDGTTRLSALVAAKDADTAERLVAAQAKADDAVSALPDSVTEAFEDPEAIEAAATAVADLKVLVSTEVASKLGVTITFSDSDGDS